MVNCKVVLLAGGFTSDDSFPTSPTIQGALMELPRRVQVRKKQSNKALEPIAGVMAVEHIIRALAAVKRLQPLADSFFLVVNECDRTLFNQKGSEGSSPLLPGLSDLGLSAANIISNGVKSATEWLGEAHDLQLALRRIGTQVPALAMSATAFTVLPAYNLQRIVEHSFIRNRDVIATRTWGPSDVAMASGPPPSPQKHALSLSLSEGLGMGSTGTAQHMDGSYRGLTGGSSQAGAPTVALAHAADTSVMPPLRAIGLGVYPVLDDSILEPLLLLKPASLDVVAAAPISAHSTLLEFAAHMLETNQICFHSIDVGPGFIPLTYGSIDHANRWVSYYIENCRSSGDGFLQQGPVEHLSNEFNCLYFGRDRTQPESTVKRVPGLSDYKLPSTFYMTQYRRLAADVMR